MAREVDYQICDAFGKKVRVVCGNEEVVGYVDNYESDYDDEEGANLYLDGLNGEWILIKVKDIDKFEVLE